jgi:iron complex outermembrane receptor protein
MGTVTYGGLGGYTRLDLNSQRKFVIDSHKVNVALFFRNLTDKQYATRYVTGYYYDRGLVIGTEITLEY